MVPAELQACVWATYVPGQEIRKDPSRSYLEAARAAIDAVAELEGVRILRPGSYAVGDQMHLDLGELLRGHGIADTPANRAVLEGTAAKLFGELGIPVDVVDHDIEDLLEEYDGPLVEPVRGAGKWL
jgi:hypothetical protein